MSKNQYYTKECLASIADKLQKRMLVAMEVVKTSAVALCPVDTGNLRSSIVTNVQRTNNDVSGTIGTNVEYAPHIEFGTDKMSAQPFLRPAVYGNQGNIKAILNGR